MLEKLDAPLGHLLRNAVDHGIESPAERRAAGKPAEGVVRLEARHSAGALQIIVSDDGRGIDLDELREAVVERNLTKAEIAAKLREAELLEFLFLPGFTHEGERHRDLRPRRRAGRRAGHGQAGARHVRVSTAARQGTRFQLQLPLTLSVVRTLLVEIGGEPYAFPLATSCAP